MTFTESYNRFTSNGSPTTSGAILDNDRTAWKKKHESREKNQIRNSNVFLSIITFSPSAVQSEIGHPWSAVEKGQAPFEMWRYHLLRSPGQSSKTFQTRKFLINKGKSMWFICNDKCKRTPGSS